MKPNTTTLSSAADDATTTDHWLSLETNLFSELLNQTHQVANRYLTHQDDWSPGRTVNTLPAVELHEHGLGTEAVLRIFNDQFVHQISNTAGPRYFGFVTGGSTPASVAGDWLVSALDQNVTGSNDSIAPQLEHQTVGLIRQLLQLDQAYFGVFVTGATMSNMVGLATARQWIGEQNGVDTSQVGLTAAGPIQVLSAAPHASIIKSLSMLGIGRNAWTAVKTLPDREAMDIDDLEHHLQKINAPVIVVASAGTVNTVDFDDLNKIGALREKYAFWLHVDGAFGAFAACSPRYAPLVAGINHADSITVDAHKWLNVPYDAAMHFTRHKNIQGRVFRNQAAYLGGDDLGPDFLHYTPENSRRFRALPAWFTLMAYGQQGYQEIIERNVSLARQLGERLSHTTAFRLVAPVRLNVVCFTLNRPNLTTETVKEFLNAVSRDGKAFFSPSVYQGLPVIRAAFSNWRTQEKDVAIAFDSLMRVYLAMFPTTAPGKRNGENHPS